jgi:peptidoglycan/LPS O-acetylase OafA/YrhL
LILAPLFGLLIFGAAGTTSRILSHPWLVLLGEASYALYILHIPVWMWWYYAITQRTDIPIAADFILYLALVVSVSVLLYKYIERPARRWLLAMPARLGTRASILQ